MSAEIETEDRAQEQARLQAESIAEMVAALNVDYRRLEALRETRKGLEQAALDAGCQIYMGGDGVWHVEGEAGHLEGQTKSEALYAWADDEGEMDFSDVEELEGLEADAGDCEDEDEARQRIAEDPLSVEVRSGWVTQGEEMEAEEFQILLCLGGPAVRIVGELCRGTPTRARIEYQDWFKPWVHAFNVIEEDTLLTYCSNFLSDGY